MIERVYHSSIPQDDVRHDGPPSRRRPRKRPAEPTEEPEDTFTFSADPEVEEETDDDPAI
jgi:hypothetical protein